MYEENAFKVVKCHFFDSINVLFSSIWTPVELKCCINPRKVEILGLLM
jgi:hypothetical protein